MPQALGLSPFNLYAQTQGGGIGTIGMRDGITKHVLIELLIQLIPFESCRPEVEIVLQFELMAGHGDDSIVREQGRAVGTNLLHESVDLADLVNVRLTHSCSDGGFRLNVSEGEYEFVATGGTGLGMTGD